MTRKSRMFALAGLMVALVVGATAVRAWSRADGCDSCCQSSCCPALVRKAPHINQARKAAHKKTVYIKKIREKDEGGCCCSERKTKAGCSCCKETCAGCCSGCKVKPECPCCKGNCSCCQGKCSAGCCTAPCCGPVCVPPPVMMTPPAPVCAPYVAYPDAVMPVPPPPPPAPPMMAVPPSTVAGGCKQYSVEMKLIEQHKGEDEKVVSSPTLCVCEGQTGQVSAGVSYTDLCAKNVPQNDMGHEGHQISVMLSPCRPDCVMLTCWIFTSERDQSCGGDTFLAESRLQTTQCVKLGKTAKLPC